MQTSAPSAHVKQLWEATDIFGVFFFSSSKETFKFVEQGRKVNGGRGETPSETPPAAETAPPISKKKKKNKKKEMKIRQTLVFHLVRLGGL